MLRPPITPAVMSYYSNSPSPELRSRKNSTIKRRKNFRSHSTEKSMMQLEDPEIAYGLAEFVTPIDNVRVLAFNPED
jgi:hypothetical protein